MNMLPARLAMLRPAFNATARGRRTDLAALALLAVLPLLWFAPVLFGGLSLLPFDNLYAFEPWRSLRPALVPHNELLSDLVLQNAVWKLHIRRALVDGQLPLWNPQIFTGLPFLAAGQASTFYPLGILFLILPLHVAYGWFTALQVGLAGMGMYTWARTLGLHPAAALAGGVIYMFSGFLIASVVFTMFIAAVAWLPFVLALIEWMVRKQEQKGVATYSPIPFVGLGAAAIGVMVLAGHPELIYYTMLTAAGYTLVRLGVAWRVLVATGAAARTALRRLTTLALWILSMAVLGIALGGVQLLPLLELLPLNFREGSASFAQVVGWAWPDRHVLTFFLPDVFGNPSHHSWFDPWTRQWQPVTVNALGEPVQTIFWGIKNYVEGANYLGLLTWMLAAVAVGYAFVVALRRRGPAASPSDDASRVPQDDLSLPNFLVADPAHPRPWIVWFCSGLAVLSLLFAFGTPLYALLYYGLPGWNQLHSPFRWVFPFTLSMAMLAAVGLHLLLQGRGLLRRPLAAAALMAGMAALAAAAASLVRPEPFIALGQRLVDGSDLAQMTFADGRMAWAYQAANLARFGLFAVLGGVWLWGWPRRRERLLRMWPLLAVALLAADLYVAHGRFNPAASPYLAPLSPVGTPPVVTFLNATAGDPLNPKPGQPINPWRFTTFNAPGAKTFNANVGMYFGWHDLRGYDSIIPRQYVALMDRIAPQADELLYNRIAPLYANTGGDVYAVLDNPLLDLLNVRYVLSEHAIPNPRWTEIYRDDAIGVYENAEVFPRAWIVPEAQVVAAEAQPLLEADLRRVVFIEEAPASEHALVPAGPQIAAAQISRYTANDIFVDVNLTDRGWLVVGDAYFPGWQAYVRPFGGDESDEVALPLYRANGGLRTVYLEQAGQWTVRMVYSPMSFKLGLYVSFLAAMTLLLLGAYWTWGKYYRPEATTGAARTVAKNSVVPMLLSLSNKAVDFAFAMLYVRLLGPAGTGQYAFVVALYGFFEIISRYGLGTLLTRDVAADKEQSSRYLTNVLILRTLLWLVALPLLGLVTLGYRNVDRLGFLNATGIGATEVQAIALLAVAMLFANWADALSSLFNAFEKLEYPAGLANAIALLKVTLGALVLLLGWGIVGLAGVSLLMNMVQTVWLYWLVRSTLFRPQWQPDAKLQRWMLMSSGPLMINHLLATIFWRIDVWILRPLAGAASVGLYSVGLKYLDGLNIVPSVFTMAVFPLMSRYARQDEALRAEQGSAPAGGSSLLRAYVLSLRLLVIISLPIAMTITVLAEPLVWLVGGGQYLDVAETWRVFGRTFTVNGGSDLALRVIIWSIPLGFVNSVTQYVLIAVHQQHYLTRAFIIGVVFNVVGNLIAIPRLGYAGAALVTILSELSLLIPFYWRVRSHVGVVPWGSIFLRPMVALLVMGGGMFWLQRTGIDVWVTAAAGGVVYLAALALLGAFGSEETAVVRRALLRNGG